MNTHNKKTTDENSFRKYILPVTAEIRAGIKNEITIEFSSGNQITVSKDTRDRNNLWEYIPPTIEVVRVEMESGIAANSGFAFPAKTSVPVDETWDNVNITPDQPIYW